MYFQLVGKPSPTAQQIQDIATTATTTATQHNNSAATPTTTTTITIDSATQCDDLEFPDPQKIINELQAGYSENLALVRQQMDTTNRESLAMLKNEMENDNERLMQMLQDSLTTAHEENILALNKAHEQEVGFLIYISKTRADVDIKIVLYGGIFIAFIYKRHVNNYFTLIIVIVQRMSNIMFFTKKICLNVKTKQFFIQ